MKMVQKKESKIGTKRKWYQKWTDFSQSFKFYVIMICREQNKMFLHIFTDKL